MTGRESPGDGPYTPGRYVISWAERGNAVETSSELANIRARLEAGTGEKPATILLAVAASEMDAAVKIITEALDV